MSLSRASPPALSDRINKLLREIKKELEEELPSARESRVFERSTAFVTFGMQVFNEIINVDILQIKDDMHAQKLFEIILLQVIRSAGRTSRTVMLRRIGANGKHIMRQKFADHFRSQTTRTGEEYYVCDDVEYMQHLSRKDLGIHERTTYDKEYGLVQVIPLA